jgi:3-hydroxyisobutyrate dehydrogenase
MADSDRDAIAVLGTGIMGSGIARNLLAAGFPVRVWNRSREKAEPLAAAGAEIAPSPAEAAVDADILVTMLSDADSLADVMSDGPLEAGPSVWVQMSTVGVEGTERLSRLAAEHEVAFVDAPVLGTRQPAEEGQLRVLASGPDEALDRCQPLFDAVGSKTLRLGPAGQGSRLKLVTNVWVLTLAEGVAEALALAEGLGADPATFLDAIADGPLDSPYAKTKAKAMIEREFPPSFPLRWASKDAELIRAAAGSAGLELPLVEGIAEALARGVQAGHGDEDLAATFLASAPGDRSRG